MGIDGKPRELHIQESLKSIDFALPEAKLLKPQPDQQKEGEQVLADCDWFRIRKFTLTKSSPNRLLPKGEQPRLIHIISGELNDRVSGKTLSGGQNYLQPYATELSLIAGMDTTLLITDQFIS